jgi:hypothetical protein
MKTKTLKIDGLPFRLEKREAAIVLGFKSHDIPILISAGLLKPLGNPSPRSPKHFSKTQIIERGEDETWMDKATKAIQKHWRKIHEKRQATP